MALGFQSGAFQTSAFQGGGAVVSVPYPPPAGGVGRGRGKKKPYDLDGKRLRLTREELDDVLVQMLERSQEPEQKAAPAAAVVATVPKKDRAIVAAFPAYPDLRDMLLAARDRGREALRRIAQRLADEEDERDVEALILWE